MAACFRIVSAFIVVSSTCYLSAHSLGEDWPQWRGVNCTGIYRAAQKLPTTFSHSDNVKWSAEIGDGIGAATIVGGKLFVTSMRYLPGQEPKNDPANGETSELPTQFYVFCYDSATGDNLWQKQYSAGEKRLPTIHHTNSYASATPAADHERVYIYFTRIGLVALDVRSGEQVWQQKVPEPFFVFDWGPGMSPVLYNDCLFFCQDDDLTPTLYCLDKKTGEILWRDQRTDFAVSYSHPIVCETPNGPELVVAGTGKLIGYDIANGQRKWAAEIFCRNIKTTPQTKDGIVYLSVESFGISYQWRATADENGDGKITREEIINSRKDKDYGIPDAFWAKFARGDKNNDGVLEGDEIDEAFLDPSNKGGLLASEVQNRGGNETDWKKFDSESQTEASIQAVRGGGVGDVSRSHTLWKHKTKAVDHLVSPLVADGRMILVKSNGFLSAFETEQGKPLFVRKRFNNTSTYLGAPVYGDGKIYIPAENGKVVVFAAGDDFQEPLAINDMGESVINTVAIADGRIYIRSRNHIFCIGQ
ncbi:outer membrane protein assembly factor BamB family protein [Schlesneria paludicola]|uniref:outer membrane protein assembly factor BamB family protein n=1 Tax=Schlesneria paludicola TaxID=360056 RepID=UPI0002EAD39D|nr:PQQ-binding-like beta-propeller repeat protein [Schlesneria paludicola]